MHLAPSADRDRCLGMKNGNAGNWVNGRDPVADSKNMIRLSQFQRLYIYQRENVDQGLVSGEFVLLFAGVPGTGASNRSAVLSKLRRHCMHGICYNATKTDIQSNEGR